MTLAFALRNLARHPLRTALTVLGVAVTSAMLLDMVMLGGGLDRSFGDLLLTRGYQVRISPKGTMPFDSEATISDFSSLKKTLESNPAVSSVAPVLGATLYAAGAGADRTAGGEALVAYGLDPGNQGLYRVRRGADLTQSRPEGVVISEATANDLRLSPGDSVVLTAGLDPLASGFQTGNEAVVLGVVEWLYDFQGQRSVGLLLPQLQRLTGTASRDPISFAMVRMGDGRDVAQETAALQRQLPRVQISSVADLVEQFRRRLLYFRQLSLILGTLSLAVSAVLLLTLLTVTVNERLGEIATLRALGFSVATVVKQIVIEGALLTLAGATLGTGLGLVTARYLDSILTSFPGLPAAVSFFVARPQSLVVAAAMLLTVGLVAGVIPALRAARLPVAVTLHQEAT